MKNLIKLILSFTVLVHGFGCTSAFAQFNAVQEQAIDKNYLANGGFENGLAGPWRTYKDAAQAAPVDGTGGTAGITIAQSTASPIQGKTSLVLTKGASNLQGEGFSVPFVIDKEARGKVLSISGSYEIVSGTYSGGTQTTDSDVEVYIYDVDTGTVIQPAGYKLDGGVTGYTYSINATFTPANVSSVNYRLILHVATTSASAYSMRLDTFKVSTQKKSQGPPVTDWQSFTPTGSWSTNTTYNGRWRRVGDTAEIEWNLALTGAPTNASLTLNLPSGLVIDTTKSAGSSTHAKSNRVFITSAGNVVNGVTIPNSTTSILIRYITTPSAPALTANLSATAPFTFANGDGVIVSATFPIVGWGSTVTMSDSADTRVVSARYTLSGTQSIPDSSLTTIIWNSKSHDTHGAMNTSTGAYVAPVPGYYRIKAAYGNTASLPIVAGNRLGVYYQINAGNNVIMSYIPYGSSFSEQPIIWGDDTAYMNAGDSLVIKAFMDYGGGPYTIQSSNGGQTYVTIERVSGPSQIAASESISAEYNSTSGQSVTNNTMTFLDFGTKESDSHNAVLGAGSGPVTTSGTGWRYICPAQGKFHVDAAAGYGAASVSNPGGAGTYIAIFKNGNQTHQGTRFDGISTGAAGFFQHNVSGNVACVPGDRIEIGLIQNAGGVTRNLSTASNNVRVTIFRTGN